MFSEWREALLGDVITLKRGYDLPARERNHSGGVPIVSSSGISGYHDSAMAKAPGVVTGRYGSVGNFFYLLEDFWPLNTSLYVQDFKGNYPHFIYYLLQTLNFAQYSGKTGVPGVNRNDLHRINVKLPPLPEQRKIAAILSNWDEAIDLSKQLLAAKQRRKQALMQRLLIASREESLPNYRFPAFTEPWQQRQFGEVFERVTRKNTIGNDNVLTISAQRGLISQTHFFNKIVASDSLSGYYLLKHGEFAYNKSYSEGYPYGAFKRLNDYDAGVLSTLYVCFCIKSPNMNSDYFVHFFEAGGMNHGIYSIAQEGARNHGLLNMSVIDLFNLPLLVPSLEEQNALAAFFNDLDHEIDLIQQKLAALRQQKQSLIQQLLTGKIRVKV